MINKSKFIWFCFVAVIAFISSVVAIYMTIIIPKPETTEVFLKMFTENTEIYFNTLVAVLIATVSCAGTIAIGSMCVIEYIKNGSYSYVYSDCIEINRIGIIIIFLVSIIFASKRGAKAKIEQVV